MEDFEKGFYGPEYRENRQNQREGIQVLLRVLGNGYLWSLTQIVMESITIFRAPLVARCSQRRAFTSDKTSSNCTRSTAASILNAFSQQKTTNISARCIRRCIKMKRSSSLQKSISKWERTGPDSLNRWSAWLIKITKAKFTLEILLSNSENVEVVSQKTSNGHFCRPFRGKKEAVEALGSTLLVSLIKNITLFKTACTRKLIWVTQLVLMSLQMFVGTSVLERIIGRRGSWRLLRSKSSWQ